MDPTQRLRLALAALVTASLACTLLGGGGATTTPAGPSRAATAGALPTLPPPAEEAQTQPIPTTVAAEIPFTACHAEQWQIIPVRHMLGTPRPDGWRLLVVELEVVNRSQVWGAFWLNAAQGGATLSTEDGSVYEILTGTVGYPPSFPEPYSGLEASEQGGILSEMLPPGFSMRGVFQPRLHPVAQFHLTFLVYQDQQHFTLTINRAQVVCYVAGEQTGGALPPLELSLGDEHPLTYPTTEQPPSVTQPVEVPNLGTLNFLSIERTTHSDSWSGGWDEVLVSFNLSNPNRGYEAQGSFYAYIIGDQAVAYPCYDGRFQIGPGYPGDANLRFMLPSGLAIGNPRLVLIKMAPLPVQMIGAFALPEGF